MKKWEERLRKFIPILIDESNDLGDSDLVDFVKQLLEERGRVEDTPEEWEEEFRDFLRMIFEDEERETKEDIVYEVKQLLEEKEREGFTREDLKVIKMSLDGMSANEICTLLDENSFDDTKEKVINKLNK